MMGCDMNGIMAFKSDQEEPQYTHGIYTGIKGQCVEYARRWLIQIKKCTFESIPAAIDLWDMTHVTRLDGTLLPFLSIPYTETPLVGDLLIYKRHETIPHGHVAVVVGVYDKSIFLAEQNWSKHEWTGYSRYIDMDSAQSQILGFKRIN
jgi:hypothetical protein